MRDKWTIIEVLQHVRHDWLNRLQLIKGNLSLGKLDQADRIMADIVMEMKQEAKLTNLKLPQFAEMLITHNWNRYTFQLEYEIVDECRPIQLDDQQLCKWMGDFFQKLHDEANPIHDNYLYVTIECNSENIRFLFHFNGIIENAAKLEHWLTYETGYPKQISFQQNSESEIIIEAIFK